MKKLKVILPAILTLAVSTSAAVTGTVAWFTATRLRTVSMDAVTAVNPESGLELTSVVNVANTKVDGVDGENKPTYTGDYTQGPKVTHAYGGTPAAQGYLRDASVDLSGENAAIYKGHLDREGTGTITGFDDITASITTPDTLTFNNKKIFYADIFSMTFTVTNGDPNFNTGLFFDLKYSQATVPTKDETDADAGAKDKALYNAVRFGFKAGSEWFVWAPFTQAVIGTPGAEETQAQFVNGTTLSSKGDYTDTTFVKGNGTGVADTTLDDTADALAASITTSYVGYLGNLKAKNAAAATPITVTCYTWFEGLDPDCVNENFTEALKGLTADFKFVSRKFKSA